MQLAFVLVEPKVPENVGAAARALCTMGFGQLWLVNSDLLTGLPMKVAYPSLNLAQSVMLYAWEMSGLSGASDVQHEHAEESRLGALRSRLESLLPELDTPPEGKLFQWAFERLPLLSDRDIGFVHTMCSNIERALHPRKSQTDKPFRDTL